MMLLGGPYFSELGQFYFSCPGDEAAKDGFLLNTLKNFVGYAEYF